MTAAPPVDTRPSRDDAPSTPHPASSMPETARRSLRTELLNVPNLLTLARIAVIPLACWLVLQPSVGAHIAAAAVVVVAAITDWLDGWLARRQGLVTLTGKFLDPLADKLLVMSLFVTALSLGWLPVWFVVIALARELAITGLRSIAVGEGVVIAAGPWGKVKTVFQLVGLPVLLLHDSIVLPLGERSLEVGRIGFALLVVSLGFSLYSGFAYVAGFYRGLEGEPKRAGSA